VNPLRTPLLTDLCQLTMVQAYLDAVYKLQEYAGVPRRKRSTGKATWPGRKQVFRMVDRDGGWDRDVVTLEHDIQPGTPLLDWMMAGGRRLRPPEPLAVSRKRARDQLAALPARLTEVNGNLSRGDSLNACTVRPGDSAMRRHP
jgi:nicotinic acid phosphoribosyltransferase